MSQPSASRPEPPTQAKNAGDVSPTGTRHEQRESCDMRIHTNRLTADDIYGILHACKKKGLIGSAVTLDIMREHG